MSQINARSCQALSHRVQTTRLVQIVEVRQATLLLVMIKISDNYFASAYHPQ